MNGQHGMWQMLRVYGVGGKLLKVWLSFYEDSRVSVPVWDVSSDAKKKNFFLLFS